MDMKEMLERTLTETSSVDGVPMEKTVEDLGEFKFSEAKDKVGLPVEHKLYVKRSCKACYGRGYQIQLFGGRRYQPCPCVNRGYVRLRMKFERDVKDVMAAYVGKNPVHAEEKVRERLLKDLFG